MRKSKSTVPKPKPLWFKKMNVPRLGTEPLWVRVPKGTPKAVLRQPRKGKLVLSGGKPVPIIKYAPKKEKVKK